VKYRNVIIASLGALPLTILTVWFASQTLRQFFDPCIRWGVQPESTLELAPNGQCRSIEGVGETRSRAVTRLVVIHGGIVMASLLGVLGALWARPSFLVGGAALLLLESIPLVFSFGWLNALASGFFLMVARKGTPVSHSEAVVIRVIGSSGGSPLYSLYRRFCMELCFRCCGW